MKIEPDELTRWTERVHKIEKDIVWFKFKVGIALLLLLIMELIMHWNDKL